MRQISHDVDTRMAGGGMMAVKGPLQEIGGWPQRSRAEDLYLIRRFTGAGRANWRIPPHGYILNRHGVDHTWRPQVDYFLFRSERQWRGLGFAVIAIDAPTDPYTRIPPESRCDERRAGDRARAPGAAPPCSSRCSTATRSSRSRPSPTSCPSSGTVTASGPSARLSWPTSTDLPGFATGGSAAPRSPSACPRRRPS